MTDLHNGEFLWATRVDMANEIERLRAEGFRAGVEAALRHAKVTTDLAELVEARLPALLAERAERGEGARLTVTCHICMGSFVEPGPCPACQPAPPASGARETCPECGGKGATYKTYPDGQEIRMNCLTCYRRPPP